MLYKQFELIDKNDIESLIYNQETESKILEYKKELPKNGSDDRREFSADVSSFANASGGIIIYGIGEKKDENGQKTDLPEIVGLDHINFDKEILRLHEILFSNIVPQVVGVQIKTIDCSPLGNVLIIKIPSSWNAPHAVKVNDPKTFRFYSRHSKGKYRLEIEEIRTRLIASESLKDKIRQFRVDRVAKLIADEGPTKLEYSTKFMLHLIPVETFNSIDAIDIRRVARKKISPLFYRYGFNQRFNLDGFLTFSEVNSENNSSLSYVQVFRNGVIEAAQSIAAREEESHINNTIEKRFLVGIDENHEINILQALREYLSFLKNLDINPPIIIYMTYTGVQGCEIGQISSYPFARKKIDRDVLNIPEAILEEYNTNLEDLMKTAFDAVWQASGYEGSPSYDNDGKWKN